MSTRTEDLLHPASAPSRAPQPKPAPVRQAVAHPGAVLSRAALAPADVLALQRTLGNQAVQRMLATRQIQAKLTVNAAGDVYEQEADAVARQVVSTLGQPAAQQQAGASVQRQPEEEKDELMAKPLIQRVDVPTEEEEKVMTMPSLQREGDGSGTVDDGVEAAIQGARGGGQPLDHGTRGQMEQAFGVDFSGVRIHTGEKADSLNKAVQARAFTTGEDIFFGGGEYNPGSSAGKELLAHELTHVVQQNGPAVSRKDRDEG